LAGSLDDALKMANAAGDLEPQNVGVLALKAAVLFRLKDTDGAIRAAQQALEIEPGNTDANVVIAVAKFSQGDADGALRILNSVTGTHQDDLGVLLLKANVLDHLGNLPQEEAVLRKLIELHPNEAAFRTQLIRFFVLHKREDDAVKELRSVVALNPADTDSELQLVGLLSAVKGPAAARAELVARINAGGKVFPYQIALAKFDFAQGAGAESIKQLEQLISRNNAPDDTLTAKITLADIYLSTKNVASAEKLIAEILSADSHNVDGLRLRASIRIDRGQFDDAIADLRSALNYQPRSPQLLASIGLAYERSGSIELADKAFFDATKASGFSPSYGLNYFAFLQRRGLTTQAESTINDLANRNQTNVTVLSALAQVKLAHQDWVGAHAIADAISKLGDKRDIADQINGAAFSGQKKFNDSLAVLQSAYDANPGAIRPMAALVTVYLQAKQADKAEAFIRAVLNANPGNAEALVLMGSIQLAKNNPDQAVKDFSAAIKLKPNEEFGYRALADLYFRQNKVDDALAVIQTGLQRQPNSFSLRLSRAGFLEAKRDFEPAIAEYEAMLKEQPGSMIIANNLVSLLTDHRTDKASLDQANSIAAILKNSEVPQFKDTLGWVDYLRGENTAAMPLLEGAAVALPNVPLVHFHLGMIYLVTGQGAKASEQFKIAQELAPNDADLKMKIDAALKTISEQQKG
jgi:cellulose synthase operon protein C